VVRDAKERRAVLIAGVDPMRNAARIPSVLAAAGCRITALCPTANSLAHSSLIERHVPSDPNDDAATVETLRRALEAPWDHVVIADEALLFAMASRLQPWMDGVLPVAAEIEALRLILDKNRMLVAMRDAGVTIPPFVTVDQADDLSGAAYALGYPLMLKDAVGAGGVGVRRVDGPGALTDAYRSLDPPGAVTLQRFVEGRAGCTEVLFDHGVPRCWTSAYMLEQWPTAFEPATKREPVSEPRIEAVARAIGAATGFHGFGGIDWIRGADDELYFLEFNARVTHIVGPARAKFGREFGAMLAGVPATPYEIVLAPDVVPVFPAHFLRALKTRRVGDLLGWLPFRPTSVDLDWRDYGIVCHELFRLVAGGAHRALALVGAAPERRSYDYTRRTL
jgi:hypothetical protein